MEITVNITKELLNNNKNYVNTCCEANVCRTCPVATELTRMGFHEVRVGKWSTTLIKGNRVYFSRNTPKFKRFLRELDQGINKKPTSFVLQFI